MTKTRLIKSKKKGGGGGEKGTTKLTSMHQASLLCAALIHLKIATCINYITRAFYSLLLGASNESKSELYR